MTQAINAFHPSYVKTYMPEFLTELRTESRQTKAGQTLSTFVDKKREKSPTHGTIQGISKKIIPAHMNRPKEMMKRPILSKKEQSMTMQEVTAELIEKLKQKGKKK